MTTPQVVMIAVYCISFTRAASKHGEPTGDKHHAGHTALAIGFSALIWWLAGFWA